MEPEYDVFISHAGEDKDTIAIPIYEGLRRRGINAFVDREELRTGSNAPSAMLSAVDKAAIGLFVLSPEYGAKRWPMLELDGFLQRTKAANEQDNDAKEQNGPVLIPFFYRSSVADCKDRLLFKKHPELLQRPDMIDRLTNGEVNIKQILESLAEVSRQTGIENSVGATNEDTELMKLKRNELVENVCERVSRAMYDLRKSRMIASAAADRNGTQQGDVFQPTFYVPRNVKEVLLDFSSALTNDVADTREAELLQAVLNAGSTYNRDRVIVVKGDGGVGKSCMLRGLREQEEVRRRFAGGVYFISLGMDASIDTLIKELLKILRLTGGHELEKQLRQEKDLDVILEKIGWWMKEKQILVLVDDLWERNGLGGWVTSRLVGVLERRSRSVVVVTTRMSSIAMAGRVIEVRAREALSRESRCMLLAYARFSEGEVERWRLNGTVEDLLMMCGGLPVCIGVVGRTIAQLILHCGEDKGVVWKNYYRVVSENREAMVKTGINEYLDLMTSLAASLEVLEENKKGILGSSCKWSYAELHRGLSVLPKPAVVPIRVVCRLWGTEDEVEALKIVEGFANVGVAGLELGGEEEGFCVRLHDLIHDFAVVCSKKAGDSCAWHGRMLEGYFMDVGIENEGKEPREWWKVVDDKYMFRNVCRHLVLSGRVKEAVFLLLRCEWAEAQHKNSGVNAWKGDFNECLNELERNGCVLEDKEVVRQGLCNIRDAVVESWSYVQGSWSEFGFQMWGRLSEEEGWVVRRFLESVEECVPRPWLKPLKQKWIEQTPNSLYGRFNLSGEIRCVVLVRGSEYAVAAGRDIWIIDVEDKRIIRRYGGHRTEIRAIGVNIEVSRLISYSVSGTVRHWDVESGEEVHKLDLEEELCDSGKHRNEFKCASIDSRRNFIVTGSKDGRVDVRDVNTGNTLGKGILACEDKVRYITGSNSGKYIAAGSDDGVVHVVDRLTEEQLGKRHHGDWVSCIAFSPDEKMAASASYDRDLRIWDVQSGSQTGESFYYEDVVMCIAFSADGQRIALGLRNGSVIVLDVEARKRVYGCYEPTFGIIYAIEFGIDSRSLLIGCSDHRLRVLRLDQANGSEESLGELRHGDPYKRRIRCLRASPDGSFYVSSSVDGAVVIWDSTTCEAKGPALEHEDVVSCVTISSDSRFIGSGCDDGKVRIWDVDTHVKVSVVRGTDDFTVEGLLP